MPYQAILNIASSKPYTIRQLESVILNTRNVYQSKHIKTNVVRTGYFTWTPKSYSYTFIIIVQGSPAIISSNMTALFKQFGYQAAVRITM